MVDYIWNISFYPCILRPLWASSEYLSLIHISGAIYRIDGTVLINRDIFDDYLERFHEPATGNDKEKKTDER